MSGEITLSMELELGWGSHMSSKYNRYSFRRKKESHYLKKLLDICDEYNVPITFNIVGKLFAETSAGDDNSELYPDGWWCDYENADDDLAQLFHAPDLIETIIDADVDHELATHTYTHVMVDEVSTECFEHELVNFKRTCDVWGVEQPVSFVSPRHRQFDPDTLTNHDIRVARVPDPNESSSKNIVSVWMLLRKHPVRKPEFEDGILKTYSSSYPSLTYSGVLPKGQLGSDPQFRLLPVRMRQYLQQRYLRDGVNRAVEQNSNAHFWTHLWDMSNEPQWKPIKKFIRWLGQRAESDDVDIRRMKDLFTDERRQRSNRNRTSV